MKKILFVLLAIGSFSTFAMSDFEMGLTDDMQLFKGSKNYKAKYINDDGTISIVKPKFSNPKGSGDAYISNSSNLDGLCKLYGLGSFVKNSLTTFKLGYYGQLVRVNSDARFSNFDSSNTTNTVKSFSCNPIQAAQSSNLKSDNYRGLYFNDDGTVTLLKPRFKINGSNSYFSTESNMNGLCKLYGFGNYVHNSLSTFKLGYHGRVVKINKKARFINFNSPYNYITVKSLMCESNL